MTHEDFEEISPGHGQFSPTLPAQASSPCQGLLSQERGDHPRHGSAAVLYHSPWFFQNYTKAQERQPALLFAENSMLIRDSTWAKDLNFIMCFVNFSVLEITYNITGSEWISI